MTLRAIALVALCSVAHAELLEDEAVKLEPVTAVVLPNGLHVVLAPDASVSSVVVHVRYGGGYAGDDHGYAHLVERLMFDGSVHVPSGNFDARIDDAGGWTSSTTAADQVSVFELVPAEALDLVLWLEAERMAGLADGITDAGLAREVAAIADERRAATGMGGYGLVERAVEKALWPGRPDLFGDGAAPTRAQLRAYIEAHIIPVNATVVLAGRFDATATLRLVWRDFGWIPGGVIAPRRDTSALPLHAIHDVVADPVPKVVVAFRTAGDQPELDVVAKLVGGRTSRLSRELVDGGLATEIHADHAHGELRIAATAAAGVDPGRLVTAMVRAIAELGARELPATTIQRATNAVAAEDVERFEALAVRADALAAGERPEVARWALINPGSVTSVVQRMLAKDDAVTVIGR